MEISAFWRDHGELYVTVVLDKEKKEFVDVKNTDSSIHGKDALWYVMQCEGGKEVYDSKGKEIRKIDSKEEDKIVDFVKEILIWQDNVS